MLQVRTAIVLMALALGWVIPLQSYAQQSTPQDSVAYTAGFYLVKDKDITIEDVAKLFKVNPRIIAELNNYTDTKQVLPEGKTIKIPVYVNGYEYKPDAEAKTAKTKPKTSFRLKKNDAAPGSDQYKFELAKNRLLLIDANLELNDALAEGAKASLDSLNLVEKTVIDEKNIKSTVHKMQRQRDRYTLKGYFQHVQDSLQGESTRMEKEKQTIMSGLTAAQLEEVKDLINPPHEHTVAKTVTSNPPTAVNEKNAEPTPPVTATALPPVPDTKPAPKVTAPPDTPKPETKKTSPPPPAAKPLDATASLNVSKPVKKPVKSSSSDEGTPNDMPTSPIQHYASAKALEPIVDSAFWQSGPEMVLPDDDKTDLTTTDTSAYISRFVIDNGLTMDNDSAYSVIVDSLNRLRAELYLTKATKSVNDKNFSNAETSIKKSIDLDPHYYDAWSMLADLHMKQGLIIKAMNEYRICEKIDSTNPRLYAKLGAASLRLKQKNDAYDYFSKSVELDSDYSPGLMGKASILISRKQYGNAINLFTRVLTLNRSNHKAYKLRGIAEYLNENYGDAIDDFTRYLIFDETDAAVFYYRGIARIAKNQHAEACIDLTTSSQMGYIAARKVLEKNCANKQ